ncbi:MAG: hypothetical protein Q3999_03435 [Buchananella hordeovulneris]|nr:hypothetical protein [Buchananella hordeovulneris]
MAAFFSRYWRFAAVLALVAGVGVALTVLRPPTVPAVVLVADVAAGQPLPAGALSLRQVSAAGVPGDALGNEAEALGSLPAVDLPAGTVVSRALLLPAPGRFEALPGQMLVPVEVVDPATWELVRRGDEVRILVSESGWAGGEGGGSAGAPQVLAQRVTVVGRLDSNVDEGPIPLASVTNPWGDPAPGRRFLVVSAPEAEATMIASHRGEGRLAILLLGTVP